MTRCYVPPVLGLLLATAALAAPPGKAAIDWSVFPEGSTSLRWVSFDESTYAREQRTYVVTRKGQGITLATTVQYVPNHSGKWKVYETKRAEQTLVTERLDAPAKAGAESTWLVCKKKTVAVHSADLTFVAPQTPCEEGAPYLAKSKAPQKLAVLSCVEASPEVLGEDELVFLPGKTVESVSSNLDCGAQKAVRQLAAGEPLETLVVDTWKP